MKKSLLFFALVLASYGSVHAQVTTSSVTGVVTEQDGTATSGATIKAVHTPSGTTYSSSANSAGRFNLPNMRVGGPYRIEITFVGQDPIVYNDIYLQLGQPFVLNPVFGESGFDIDEVTVTGAINQTNAQTGAATNVGEKQLQELPQINRSLLDFTRLTPQANGNSFAGRDARYNNLQIDGANFNNGFGLSSNPIPGGNSQPISLDAIEEISVNIAPFDVTQSGFTGAGINAVTRSGTNRIEGSAYYFLQNQNLQGRKIGGVTVDKVDAAKRNFGFRLGGPIIKDKLFLFVNAEREEATGANASGANLWRASENGVADPDNNIARTSRADLEAVRSHLINQWGWDPGRYEGYANEAKEGSTKFLARLDWNIDDVHKLALRYNQVIGNSMQVANASSGPRPRATDAYGRVGQNSITFENGNYAFKNVVQSLTAELNSNFNASFSNQFLATYSRIQDTRSTPNSQLFPFVDIGDGSHQDFLDDPANVGKYPGFHNNYMSFGTELFSYNNDVINNNYSIINNLNYVADKHNFTFGAAFEIQNFGNSYTRMGTSYYRYNSVEDFLTTGTANEVAPIMFGLTYPYEGQETYSRVNFGLASLYAQDRWNVDDKLMLTVGLRAELPIYLNKLTANPSINELELLDINGNATHYDSGMWPKSRIMLSPRVGVNYDVFGDRSLVLRGGTGVFSGRVPFVWLTNMPTNAGVLQNTIEPGSYSAVAGWIGNVNFSPDPYYHLNNVPAGAENVFISQPNEGAPSSFALVDRDFKMPMVWRTSIGGDYKIPNTPLMLTGDFLYTRDINAVFQFGANLVESSNRMNYGDGGDDRLFYPNQPEAYNPEIGANNVTVLTNTSAKGYALSATLGLSIPQYQGFSGGVYYTYSDAREVTANAGSNAGSAWGGSPNINGPNDQILHRSAFALPHRVLANLSYRLEYANALATTVGVYYDGSNQGRFSYIYANDINNDGQNADLIYLPSDLNTLPMADITNDDGEVVFSVAEQRDALQNFVNENGLSKYQGKYLPRNGFLMPWLNRFDVRVLQDVFTNIGPRRHTLQFSLDIVNFGNLINKDNGIQSRLNNANQLLGTSSTGADGSATFVMQPINNVLPTTPFQNVSTIATTWQMQFGVRYIF